MGCKKQGAKKQGHCYSKKEEATWFFSLFDQIIGYFARETVTSIQRLMYSDVSMEGVFMVYLCDHEMYTIFYFATKTIFDFSDWFFLHAV